MYEGGDRARMWLNAGLIGGELIRGRFVCAFALKKGTSLVFNRERVYNQRKRFFQDSEGFRNFHSPLIRIFHLTAYLVTRGLHPGVSLRSFIRLLCDLKSAPWLWDETPFDPPVHDIFGLTDWLAYSLWSRTRATSAPECCCWSLLFVRGYQNHRVEEGFAEHLPTSQLFNAIFQLFFKYSKCFFFL